MPLQGLTFIYSQMQISTMRDKKKNAEYSWSAVKTWDWCQAHITVGTRYVYRELYVEKEENDLRVDSCGHEVAVAVCIGWIVGRIERWVDVAHPDTDLKDGPA